MVSRSSIDFSRIEIQPVRVFYLKMHASPEDTLQENNTVTFEQLSQPITRENYLRLYGSVGIRNNWVDRFIMSEEVLLQKINATNVIIYVMKVNNEEAGFIELVREEKFVELLYFGLFPEFIGKGFGKYFLNWSIRKAWSFDPDWIQLNTCALDNKNALPTYIKAGFVQYKTTVEQRRILK
jgi:GNAT superfamily N-acetyltransferase